MNTVNNIEAPAGILNVGKVTSILVRLALFVASTFAVGGTLMATNATAATFYVNNTCASNGNGKATTCATSSGGAGAWNSLGSSTSCSGMAPGDRLQIMAGSAAGGGTGFYNESGGFFQWKAGSTSCMGTSGNPIFFENYCNGSSCDNITVDGTKNIRGSTWTSLGGGVWQCSAGTCNGNGNAWAWTAYYKINNGAEQQLYLQQTTTACNSNLPAGYMRMTAPGAGQICVHLPSGVSPSDASVTQFRIPVQDTLMDMIEVVPTHDITIRKNPAGGSLTFQRARFGITNVANRSQRITIDGVTVTGMMDRCLNFDYTTTYTKADYVVRNTHVSHCGQDAIHWNSDTGVSIFENNEVDHIQNYPEFDKCHTAAGNGCFPRFNDNGTALRWGAMSNASVGSAIRGNKFHDIGCGRKTTDTGYGTWSLIDLEEGSANTVIENNLFYNAQCSTTYALSGIGLLISNASDSGTVNITVRNNLFFNVDNCILFQFQGSGTPFNMNFYNNTCVNPGYSGIGAGGGWGTPQAGSIINVVNNIFYASATPASGLMMLPNDTTFKKPTNNSLYCSPGCAGTIATYLNGKYTSANIGSIDTTNLWGDPNIDTSGGSPPPMKIKSASGNAYQKGIVISPIFADYLNAARPASGAWDIGANEFYSGGGAPLLPPTNLRALP